MVLSLCWVSCLEQNPRDKCMVICIHTFMRMMLRLQPSVSHYLYLHSKTYILQIFTLNCTLICHNYDLCQGTVCYDDGCHLKRYACNPARSTLTATAGRLSSMNFAIDRMHFKGHTDVWCHQHCDPNKLKELEKVGLFTLLISTSGSYFF